MRCGFLLQILKNIGPKLLDYLVESRVGVGRLRMVDPVRIEAWIHVLNMLEFSLVEPSQGPQESSDRADTGALGEPT